MKLLSPDSQSRYDFVAILLHWVMVAGLLWLIFTAHFEGVTDADMQDRIKLHSGVGMSVGLAGLFRLFWRLQKPRPNISVSGPAWQKKIAAIVVNVFYALFLLMPLVGFILAGIVSYPVQVFGLFDVSGWLNDNPGAAGLMNSVHGFLADTLLVFAAIHAGAALYHHFHLKDDVLAAMIPFLNRRQDSDKDGRDEHSG